MCSSDLSTHRDGPNSESRSSIRLTVEEIINFEISDLEKIPKREVVDSFGLIYKPRCCTTNVVRDSLLGARSSNRLITYKIVRLLYDNKARFYLQRGRNLFCMNCIGSFQFNRM